MKVNPRRIQQLLEVNKYELAWVNRDDESALIRRSRVNDELFELLIIGWAGQRGEAVFADAAVSVVRGWATKGLIETEQITDIDDDPQQRWSIIEDRTRAEDWEAKLARIAPVKCEELANRVGLELLERTRPARTAVQKYIAQLPDIVSPRETLEWLRIRCTADDRTEADRLRQSPGVLQMDGGEMVYEIAALLIVLFGAVIEGGTRSGIADPQFDVELMWRIQLLRDRLVNLWPSVIKAE